MNLCTGSGGSVQMDARTTAEVRLGEARRAAEKLGATFYPPLRPDLELVYDLETLRMVAAVVRKARPGVVLTHSPEDYMEDHTNASRLAVTATFAHGVPNFPTSPPTDAFFSNVTLYHAMPHGLRTTLRQRVRAGLYVNTTPVQHEKRAALECHASQRDWLDVSQGMDSYVASMDDMARSVGRLSGAFEYAEGWRRHLHLGLSGRDEDPLAEALGGDCIADPAYEAALESPV